MNNSITDQMREIKAIEDRYGLILFRMSLTHLIDIGVRHMDNENAEEAIKQIMTQDEADKANGITKVMTADFQCSIVRCAVELSRFSIWTIITYIKKYVVVS